MTHEIKPAPVEQALVDSDWLADHIGDDNIKLVDGSWHMPAENRNPGAEFLEGHIPGAVFFDIDTISDTSNPLPHMYPDSDSFSAAVSALGIGNDDHVICYDQGAMTACCRVWWMFRSFGHTRVSVLNGGLAKWKNAGQPVDSGPAAPTPGDFTADYKAGMVRSRDHILSLCQTGSASDEQILDARSNGRFTGRDPEPRKELRGGHMPGAFSLPFPNLMQNGVFKDSAGLRAAVGDSGIDFSKPVVTSCGSGVTAAVLLLGLHILGHDQLALYDGSWTEWGGDPDVPIVKDV